MKRSISVMAVAALLVTSGGGEIAAQTFEIKVQPIVSRTAIAAPALQTLSPALGLTPLAGPGLPTLSPALRAIDAARLEPAAPQLFPQSAPAALRTAGLPAAAAQTGTGPSVAAVAAGLASSPALAKTLEQDERVGTAQRVESARVFFDQARAAGTGADSVVDEGVPAARAEDRLASPANAPQAHGPRGIDDVSRSWSEHPDAIASLAFQDPAVRGLTLVSQVARLDESGAPRSWHFRFEGYRGFREKLANRRTVGEVVVSPEGRSYAMSVEKGGLFGSRAVAKPPRLPAGSATLGQAVARIANDYPEMVVTEAEPFIVEEKTWSTGWGDGYSGGESTVKTPVWRLSARRSRDNPNVAVVFTYTADKLQLRDFHIVEPGRQAPELLAPDVPVWVRVRPSAYDLAPARLEALRARVLKDFGARRWHPISDVASPDSWRMKVSAADYRSLSRSSSEYPLVLTFEYDAPVGHSPLFLSAPSTPPNGVKDQPGSAVGVSPNPRHDGQKKAFAQIVADTSRHPSIASLKDASLYWAEAELDESGAASWTLRFAGYDSGWSKFINRQTLVDVAIGPSGALYSAATQRGSFFGTRKFNNVVLPAGSAGLTQALRRFADDFPDMIATSARPASVVDGYWSSSGMRDDPGQEVFWDVPVWSIQARSKDNQGVTAVLTYSADKLLLRSYNFDDAARQEPELLPPDAPVWARLRPSTLMPYDIAPAQIDAIRDRVLKDFGATEWHDAKVNGEAYSWRVKLPAAQYLRLRKSSSAYRVTSLEFEYAAERGHREIP